MYRKKKKQDDQVEGVTALSCINRGLKLLKTPGPSLQPLREAQSKSNHLLFPPSLPLSFSPERINYSYSTEETKRFQSHLSSSNGSALK